MTFNVWFSVSMSLRKIFSITTAVSSWRSTSSWMNCTGWTRSRASAILTCWKPRVPSWRHSATTLPSLASTRSATSVTDICTTSAALAAMKSAMRAAVGGKV